MTNPEIPEGDRRAWLHAIQSGRLNPVDPAEAERAITVLCYVAQEIDKATEGVTEAQVETLLDWMGKTRIASGLLDGLLAGHLYVRVPDAGEPQFSLSPKGSAYARDTAERMGLPDLGGQEQ